MDNVHDELAGCLRAANRILVFTGAGISTGSGIPDYRGPSGVWRHSRPVYYHEFMASEESRGEYWRYKLDGWKSFREAQPNKTHKAIAHLEVAGKLHTLITQNIDGLHSRGGSSDENLIELHGTNSKIECQTCGALSDPEPHFQQFAQDYIPPLCACGGFLKPATISFGQQLRDEDLARAMNAAQEADMAIACGSTLSVSPAADIPLLAAQRGVPYIIINRGVTDHDEFGGVTLRIDGDVERILPPAIEEACAGC